MDNEMKHIERYLSPEWQALVKATIKKFVDREELWCTDFNSTLIIRFEDGSQMNLKHAIFLRSEKLQQTAIFTEHCGYFVLDSRLILQIKINKGHGSSEVQFNQIVEKIL